MTIGAALFVLVMAFALYYCGMYLMYLLWNSKGARKARKEAIEALINAQKARKEAVEALINVEKILCEYDIQDSL